MTSPPRLRFLLVALLAIGVIAGGCGGSDEPVAEDSSATDEPETVAEDSDSGDASAASDDLLGDDLCPQFEGETLAGIGPLVIQRDELVADTMWQCVYLLDDSSAGLQFSVSSVPGAGYESMITAGNAESIDGLGKSAVAISGQDVRVETNSGPELIVTVFDYQNPNDQGTFADLEKSQEVARLLLDSLGLG